MKINHIETKKTKLIEPIKKNNQQENKTFLKIWKSILKKSFNTYQNIQKKNNNIIIPNKINLKNTELKKKQIQLLIQINNKIIQTYEEIMNMPI
ncbi:Flagellar hook-basal body complex protein FliE [Buchnera aphidicola (Cinara piceae)]|uniref:Flagellar hook-basal body complex protein FliE n=1 Tax=Buchnera aphidicola (Cinara piceae) TaxID=1660043 RepID=A0A803GCE8_9GAMM|nr:flagellar hook-basal body complex protein FliE [Buchnera aphidicola]VFP87861.1 Flagellar hook-basal body complex protein FliE [Buchnera aphidicola (Cinara piceae)]